MYAAGAVWGQYSATHNMYYVASTKEIALCAQSLPL